GEAGGDDAVAVLVGVLDAVPAGAGLHVGEVGAGGEEGEREETHVHHFASATIFCISAVAGPKSGAKRLAAVVATSSGSSAARGPAGVRTVIRAVPAAGSPGRRPASSTSSTAPAPAITSATARSSRPSGASQMTLAPVGRR